MNDASVERLKQRTHQNMFLESIITILMVVIIMQHLFHSVIVQFKALFPLTPYSTNDMRKLILMH